MRENRLPQISAQLMALPSQQHLKWTLEFISSIKVEGVTVEGPFCILDGLPASLPPKAFYPSGKRRPCKIVALGSGYRARDSFLTRFVIYTIRMSSSLMKRASKR